MNTNICFGCEGKDQATQHQSNVDHLHQYINIFGDTKICWYIDGQNFMNQSDASAYLINAYGTSQQKAFRFLFELRRIYN